MNWLIALILLFLLSFATASANTEHGKSLYESNCLACHTIGGGDFVGPDLLNVTEKRDTDWLINFIRSSQTMIREGDELAVKLYEQYNRLVMPDFKNLSDDDIKDILSWINQASEKAAEAKSRPANADKNEYGAVGNRVLHDTTAILEQWNLLRVIYWTGAVFIFIIALVLGYFIAVRSRL